ncbi:hypothetical protein MKW98_027299 [Papaver atlanticum]|uniref:Neprosin PEP catalytic domain-containing protein n=1 Tax=Papaver atlanticum TaxID=357466 RepID=A0AAD4XHE8_9MAGN|nr:hypothetical protein MKW98_027299 [Papaver atlanticum]
MRYLQISFIIFYVLISSILISSATHYVDGKRSISKTEEDDIEIERQLRVLNKKPVKTIITKVGDIMDCVDIYMQPAFDNPLLKDHKIQMNPNSVPGETTNKTISSSSIFRTVPIRRTTRADLVDAKHFLKKTRPIHANDMGGDYLYAEEVIQDKRYLGGATSMSIHNLTVDLDQTSTSQIWIMNGPPEEVYSVEVGIMKSPMIFGDSHSRLFGSWSHSRLFGSWTSYNGAQRIGCFNMMCPGFIQISSAVSFGHEFTQSSIYGQISYDVYLMVSRSQSTGNWWLSMGSSAETSEPVGYWPSELFTQFKISASSVKYGGYAVALSQESTPPLGNGYLPQLDDYKMTAFMSKMQFVNETGGLVDLNPHSMQTKRGPLPQCYDIKIAGQLGEGWFTTMVYWGPGGMVCALS